MLRIVSQKSVIQLRNCLFSHYSNGSTMVGAAKSYEGQFYIFPNKLITKLPNEKSNLKKSTRHNNKINSSTIRKFKFNQANRLSSSEISTTRKKRKINKEIDPKKPNFDDLDNFFKYIENSFPKFFHSRIDSNFFEFDLEFEDNQSGFTKLEYGYVRLLQKIMLIKLYYSLMYSFNIMNVLSMAKLPDEGLVKVRWRITSKGRLFVFLQFWRIKELTRKEYWNDGIVYFYLNGNGKVYRIVLEKIEKDKQEKLLDVPLRKVVKI